MRWREGRQARVQRGAGSRRLVCSATPDRVLLRRQAVGWISLETCLLKASRNEPVQDGYSQSLRHEELRIQSMESHVEKHVTLSMDCCQRDWSDKAKR